MKTREGQKYCWCLPLKLSSRKTGEARPLGFCVSPFLLCPFCCVKTIIDSKAPRMEKIGQIYFLPLRFRPAFPISAWCNAAPLSISGGLCEHYCRFVDVQVLWEGRSRYAVDDTCPRHGSARRSSTLYVHVSMAYCRCAWPGSARHEWVKNMI